MFETFMSGKSMLPQPAKVAAAATGKTDIVTERHNRFNKANLSSSSSTISSLRRLEVNRQDLQ
jgi:hypothetical protein